MDDTNARLKPVPGGRKGNKRKNQLSAHMVKVALEELIAFVLNVQPLASPQQFKVLPLCLESCVGCDTITAFPES